jgi:hypothetical protein
VLQGGVPLPVCVVEGRPSTCLCCRRVSSCLSVLLGCVPLPVRGPPELQSGMFLFWLLHSFSSPFSFTPWHCTGPLQPLLLILSMVFQLSLPPCKFSLCIFFSFLVLPWSAQLPTHPRISSHGLHHLYQLSVAQDPSAHPRDSLLPNFGVFGHQAINIDPTWALFLALDRASKTRKFEPPSALIGALEGPQSLCQFPEFSLFVLFIPHPFLDQFPQLLDYLNAPVSLFLLTPFIIFIGLAGHPPFYFLSFCVRVFCFWVICCLPSNHHCHSKSTHHPKLVQHPSFPPSAPSVPGSSPSSSPSSLLCMSRSLDIPG